MTLPIYRDTFAKMQMFRWRTHAKPGLEITGCITIPKHTGFKAGEELLVRIYEPSTGRLWQSVETCDLIGTSSSMRVYVTKENRPDDTALCVVALDRLDGDRTPIMEVGQDDRVTCGRVYPLKKTSRLVLSKTQRKGWKDVGIGTKVECTVHEVGSDTVYRLKDRRVSYCNTQYTNDGETQHTFCIFLPKAFGLAGKRCLAVYHVQQEDGDDA